MAETSKFRGLILTVIDRYTGEKPMSELDVIDIGSGDDPLTTSCDKFDLPHPYTVNCNVKELTYKGDARVIDVIVTKKYDVVYSSHLLEDFARNETAPVLEKWCSLLKDEGVIVLLLPDQQRYEAFCKSRGEQPNVHHQISEFSMEYIRVCFEKIPDMQIIFCREMFEHGEYNFLIAAQKKST